MAATFTTSGSGLINGTNGLAKLNPALFQSPTFDSRLFNPTGTQVPQGGMSNPTTGTGLVSGGFSMPSANASQDVKKVVSGGDGSQEVHFYPTTSTTKPTSVDTSSFTPQQLTAFNAANALGTGVLTTSTAPQSITGNTTTPSGATVNATTGQLVSSPSSTSSGATFPGLVNSLSSAAQGNQAIGQNAANIAANYGKQIGLVNTQAAGLENAYGTTPGMAFPTSQGLAQSTAATAGQVTSGLAAAEEAALAGTGQQLTAQGQTQSGLTSAANLAQPSGNYPFVYNPLTGTFTNAGGGSVMSAQDAAQAVISHKMTYDQAKSALGYLGSTGESQLQSAITSAGGNVTQLQAQGVGQSNVLAGLPQLESANTAAQGIQSTIMQFLQSNPDINATNVALSNAAQQWINNKAITDPRYQTLFNYLNEYTNTLAPILGVGGSPTNLKTSIAQSFINPQAGASSIISVLKNMSQLADDKVKNLQSGAQGGGIVAGGSSPGTKSNSTGGWASLGD